MTPEELSRTVVEALQRLADAGSLTLPDGVPSDIAVERPKVRAHGDYATSAALQLAKRAGTEPRELAELLAVELKSVPGIAGVEVAGPGFLNITLGAEAQGEVARAIIDAGKPYGDGAALARSAINLEFVSANPTGPVTLASTRGAALGDSMARLMQAQGAGVAREYYFNDAGAQIDRFSLSLLAAARGDDTPEGGYPGEYIADVAAGVVASRPDVLSLDADDAQEVFRVEGVRLMFDEVKQTLHAFGVDFDVYFSERSLHESGAVDAAVERLRSSGLTYQAEGAVWLRSTDYGDDKDRVIIRSDGRPTYICGDAAYYLDKRARGFDKVVILLGADHHGYIGRYRAIAAAFGDDPDQTLELVIHQMVNLLKDGEPVRMGKRAGTFLTLDDLVDAVGVDAARYALVRYSIDSNIDIDLDLWTRQRADNPVYYVQYAHARMSRILRNAEALGLEPSPEHSVEGFDPALLSHERERDLLRELADFPSVVATAAELREPHRVARYLESASGTFHRFYDDDACRVLPRAGEAADDLNRARLLLVAATRSVLARGLGLLGVSAPETM